MQRLENLANSLMMRGRVVTRMHAREPLNEANIFCLCCDGPFIRDDTCKLTT
jgi:hypothetical protein